MSLCSVIDIFLIFAPMKRHLSSFLFGLIGMISLFSQTMRADDGHLFALVRNYTIDDYKASCQNWDISVSSRGTIYVANNSGLLEFDGNTWYKYQTPTGDAMLRVDMRGDTIFTKGEESQGFWTFTAKRELEYQESNQLMSDWFFRRTDLPDSLVLPKQVKEANPTVYAETSSLRLIGTEQGLFILDKDGQIRKHLSMGNQLQDNFVHAICVQDDTRIWLALDNGVAQIDINPPVSMLSQRSKVGKLQNAGLHGLTLYIQTNMGYFKRQLDTSQSFVPVSAQEASTYISAKPPKTLTLSDGLFSNPEALQNFREADAIYPTRNNLYWLVKGNEAGLFLEEERQTTLRCRILFDNFNTHLTTRGPHFFALNDSLYLVSAMQGVLLVNVSQLTVGTFQINMPRIRRIEYKDWNGRHSLPVDTTLAVLPHRFEEVNIYVGTTVFTPSHQLSYWLEGVSTEWSAWQNNGKISFSQLPEGKYKLRVRRYVTQGDFPEITLNLKVSPAWYGTIWAYIAYVLLAWLGIQCILRFNLRRLKRDELEQQRQAELQAQREEEILQTQQLKVALQNKNNELILQTSALVRRNQAIQSFMVELEAQKELLGDRYPQKLYKKLHQLMEEAIRSQEDWSLFDSYFQNAHQHFVERLQHTYPDLTAGDLRICCLLRMNLSTKELASLLNISVRAVELRRYRLRKRLGLNGDTNLVDFLMKL